MFLGTLGIAQSEYVNQKIPYNTRIVATKYVDGKPISSVYGTLQDISAIPKLEWTYYTYNFFIDGGGGYGQYALYIKDVPLTPTPFKTGWVFDIVTPNYTKDLEYQKAALNDLKAFGVTFQAEIDRVVSGGLLTTAEFAPLRDMWHDLTTIVSENKRLKGIIQQQNESIAKLTATRDSLQNELNSL